MHPQKPQQFSLQNLQPRENLCKFNKKKTSHLPSRSNRPIKKRSVRSVFFSYCCASVKPNNIWIHNKRQCCIRLQIWLAWNQIFFPMLLSYFFPELKKSWNIRGACTCNRWFPYFTILFYLLKNMKLEEKALPMVFYAFKNI